MSLRTTPFHPRTGPLSEGQAWRRWAGYVVASSYELSHDREYHAIRSSAALFDVSPLYKYLVTGKDAARLLDHVVTRNVGKAKIGQVLYTPWCDNEGKQIDDGTISVLAEQTYRMTSADPTLRWLHLNASRLDVQIEDVSERTAAVSLQGPSSREILQLAAERDLSALKYFRLTSAKIRGIPVTISRTGYTGDLGYEVWVDSAQAVPLWDALIDTGTPYGITPAGMLALDVARIEAGLLLIEVDYFSSRHALIEAQKSSPLELGLGWTVATDKGRYNGQEALEAERARGPSWQFTGLTVDWDSLEQLYADVGLPPRLPSQAWRTSVPIYDRGGRRQIGYATSGGWSPLLKRYMALAHLGSAHARSGTEVRMEVTVEHHRKQAQAQVTPLPFFNPERKRA
ncbi:MAG TPA: aminomethyltransferase family protein [Gemmatimonadales bacterium]|jgi:aminomethyltransferase|nr:aminomethyltransferase family protein [Gemmatimonadales bacterium]